MNIPRRIGCCCCLALILSLIAAAPNAPAQQTSPAQSAPTTQPSADPAFRLSPGDTIEVKFFYNNELDDTVQVRPDGFVSLQLVGEVPVGGKTVPETAENLEKMYAEFLVTPSVAVQVRGYGPRRAYVGGEVERPSVINLLESTTVLDAVIEAGGIKRSGSRSSALLIRKGPDGRPTLESINLQNASQKPSAAALTLLQPYDVVLIPETKISKLNRWVDQYIRQMSPVVLTGGFNYFLGGIGAVR